MDNQEKESSSPKPTTPRPTDSNPYPTTFVQADTTSFKHVVQMLTGSPAANPNPNPNPNPPNTKNNPNPFPPKANGPKKPAFKLYERRNSLKNLSTISPLTSFSPLKQHPDILSPTILDFPSLALSPVTPLFPDPFNPAAAAAEEKAIADKGFYLHPSPRGSNMDAQPPRLLPLFPLTSPRASCSQYCMPN